MGHHSEDCAPDIGGQVVGGMRRGNGAIAREQRAPVTPLGRRRQAEALTKLPGERGTEKAEK